MRVSLLASATAATLKGWRFSSPASQGGFVRWTAKVS